MHTLPSLPPAVAREAFASLCRILPVPPDDTADARASRDALAMQALADLRPAGAFEVQLAVDVIAADAHAKDSLRQAAVYVNDYLAADRCRARFASLMRQMQSALRTLQRFQAERQNVQPAPAPQDIEPPRPAILPAPAADPLAAAAEDYAIAYPFVAARIRTDGGLSPAAMAGFDPAILPTDPAIIAALANGTSPILSDLDAVAEPLAQAA